MEGSTDGAPARDVLVQYARWTKRTCAPEQTLARLEPLFAMAGITRIGDVTGLDRIGIPVAHCIRPNARSLSVSQGKGPSLAHAKVSAAMESLELHCAEHYAPHRERARFRELGAGRAIDPRCLNLAEGSVYNRDTMLDWVWGHELIGGEDALVPYELVHCDYVEARGAPQIPGFYVSSNGLGSGNVRSEAIVHALTEVIERDATARTDGPSPERMLELGSVDDDLNRLLLDRIARANVDVFVWRQHSRVDVPSFGCALFEVSAFDSVFTGYGCHLDPRVALTRAITEAAQSRVTYIAGARDDLTRRHYAGNRQRVARLLEHLREASPMLDLRTVEDRSTPTLEQDIEELLRRLDAGGCPRAVVVDLTDRGLGLPVVRAVVPGLGVKVEGGASRPAAPRELA